MSLIPDGIWIGLDHQTYIDDPALGGTDIKGLLTNACQWHGRCRNPVWKEILANSAAPRALNAAANGKSFGTAFHTIALEPDEFDARYCLEPEAPDWPKTKEEIIADIEAIGGETLKLSAKRDEHVERARAYGLSIADDWPAIRADILAGRETITPEWHMALTTMRAVLDGHSQAPKFLRNGLAELSVFYTDENGDRYKVRFDYLRVRTVVDLKTYAMREGMGAVDAFNANRHRFGYEVPAAQYMHVRREVLPGLVEAGKVYEVGAFGPESARAEPMAFMREVAAWTEPRWFWIAASTGGVPEIDTVEFDQRSMAFASAQFQVQQAKDTYRAFRAKFGPSDDVLWTDDRGLIALSDGQFSQGALNRGAQLFETLEG